MRYDVVTVGSATVDLFADTDSELIKIDTRTSHEELIAYPLGSKILINELHMTTGGGGTNTAVSFSRLGLKTAFLGKIGSDDNGEFVIAKLREFGVEFIGARDGQTGLSIILDSIEHDRTILAFKGANNYLQPDEVPEIDSRWLYISSMLGDSFKTVVQLAAKTRARIAFNPSSYQAKQGYDALEPLLRHAEVLVLNREEACQLLGLRTDELRSRRDLLKRFRDLPPKYVVVTDGPKGATAFDGEHLYRGHVHEDVPVIETTGAGDAFASAFVGALSLDYGIAEALDIGMTNAESVISHKGAKNILLTLDEINQRRERKPRRIEKEAVDEHHS